MLIEHSGQGNSIVLTRRETEAWDGDYIRIKTYFYVCIYIYNSMEVIYNEELFRALDSTTTHSSPCVLPCSTKT